ncbi:MAG: hypothetical protein M1822_004592 [Bathelium mastoideum]|nr:MAG: hypothetical protein M1822_004592 [Bathelium mastoideum]
MYMRALQGYEAALGPKHTLTLDTVNNLGILYKDQGKLAEAEAMYMRALQGKEEVLGPRHTSALMTINNLGDLYAKQGKLAEAEAMRIRALRGKMDIFESLDNDQDTSDLVSILSIDVPPSLTSGSTLSDMPIATSSAQEFVEILLGDGTLQLLLPAAFERVGANRFKQNLFRMITKYAVDLRAEAGTLNQRKAAGLVGSRANYITYLIAQRMRANDEAPSVLQEPISMLERQLSLERFLEQQGKDSKSLEPPMQISMSNGSDYSTFESSRQVNIPPDEQEEDDMGEPGKPRLVNLEEAFHFAKRRSRKASAS